MKLASFNDVWFLTLALPYNDVVITERMRTSIIRQAKLDKKCNTIILSSINELGKYLYFSLASSRARPERLKHI